MNYNQKMTVRNNALDACGLGHDVEAQFNEGAKRIAAILAKISERMNAQLAYNLLTNIPCGVDLDGAPIEHAVRSGLVSAIGADIGWDVEAARTIAAEILQDVNDHDTAAKLFALAKGAAAEFEAATEEITTKQE
jgi:hypothetical protein